MRQKLALLGGTPAFDPSQDPKALRTWPIMTEEDEAAALEVVRANSFSGTDITQKLEAEFCQWLDCKYALAFCNGTMSLAAAMYGVGLKAGDEIICTTKTYWASIVQAMTFGAVPVFCNIDNNLSMDPGDIERCISPRTKAIMAVHYNAYPCDMDPIMAIAEKHGLKVIEDVSHAQGGMYKGRRLGTIGHVAGMSLMSQKSFAAGELGMLVTSDPEIYERALAYGHHNFFKPGSLKIAQELNPYANIALSGMKGRANQLCSALARVQLKYYDQRCVEVRKAMNYFWDQLEKLPGIRAIRVDEATGSTMGGWCYPHGQYVPEELGGLSVERFCQALTAEGVRSRGGANFCLHNHPIFKDYDMLGLGKPSRIAFADRDVRELDALCAPSEGKLCFSVPRLVKFDKEAIDRYVAVYKKVTDNYQQLLKDDHGTNAGGAWMGFGSAR